MTFQTQQNNDNNRDSYIKKELQQLLRSYWLGMRDLNPRSWDQNPVPYRLANPQYRGDYTKSYVIKLVIE
jgi:hypothetical protein